MLKPSLLQLIIHPVEGQDSLTEQARRRLVAQYNCRRQQTSRIEVGEMDCCVLVHFFFRRAENNGSTICLRSHLNRRIPATGNTLLHTEFSSVVLGCLALLVNKRNTKNNTLLQWRYFCDGLLPTTLYLYNRSDNILLNQTCLLLHFG